MSQPVASYLVLDLETILDPALPSWDPLPDGRMPPPQYHRPIVFGVLWLGPDYSVRKLGIIGDPTHEGQMIRDFAEFLNRHAPDLVTWNGRGFDLPVIAYRCLVHGVPLTRFYTERGYRYRFSAEGHMDLCDFLGEHGAAGYPRLDTVARLIGLPGKLGIEGKHVAPLWEQGRIDEIQAYCLADVVQTAFLFLRVQLMRGVLDLDGYRRAANGMYDALKDDSRLAGLFAHIELDKVLLQSKEETKA